MPRIIPPALAPPLPPPARPPFSLALAPRPAQRCAGLCTYLSCCVLLAQRGAIGPRSLPPPNVPPAKAPGSRRRPAMHRRATALANCLICPRDSFLHPQYGGHSQQLQVGYCLHPSFPPQCPCKLAPNAKAAGEREVWAGLGQGTLSDGWGGGHLPTRLGRWRAVAEPPRPVTPPAPLLTSQDLGGGGVRAQACCCCGGLQAPGEFEADARKRESAAGLLLGAHRGLWGSSKGSRSRWSHVAAPEGAADLRTPPGAAAACCPSYLLPSVHPGKLPARDV